MENQQSANNNEIKDIHEPEKSKSNKKKIDRFAWWQTLLLLTLTLAISVTAGYYISDKYFWSDVDKNRINQQLEYYQAQVDKEPNNATHRVNLGYTYFLKGKNDDAIKQLKVALDLDKNNFNAYLNLSIVYNDQERFDDAIKSAQKAADISPRDYKGHLQKGIVYRKLKMYDEAIESLQKANELMRGNTDIIYEIGRVAEDQGDNKIAEDLYKEALGYDPLYKPALEGLDRVAAKDSNKN